MEFPSPLDDLSGRRRIFEARARFLQEVRGFFRGRRFLEVDAPLLVPSGGMEPHLDAFRVEGTATGARAFLPTSPEFYLKKLLASGVERCFSLGPAFRDELPSPSHSPEFLMLEWYRAGASLDRLAADCGALLSRVGKRLAKGGAVEGRSGPCDLARNVELLSLSAVFEEVVGVDWLDLETEEEWRRAAADHGGHGTSRWTPNDCFSYLMLAAVEPVLAGRPGPVAVMGYPAFQAALAALDPRDPRVARRFELFAGGVELANAYEELTDEVEQRSRYRAYQRERRRNGKPAHPPDEDFFRAVGRLPPCAGIAMGADRLLGLLLGLPVGVVRHGPDSSPPR